MLQGGQPLTLSADERAERIAVIALGDDVEPARLAGGDFYVASKPR